MTSIAGIGRVDMAGIFSSGCGAIVAGGATTVNFCMVNLSNRSPVGWCMAALTAISSVNVRRVFASSNGAVMATGTVGCTGGVSKCCISPATFRIVAVYAGVATGKMVSRLSGSCGAVVTAFTTTHDFVMVNLINGRPGC